MPTKKFETVALPQLPDGRTYITQEMLEDDPAIKEFFERTRDSWEYGPWNADYYVIKKETK